MMELQIGQTFIHSGGPLVSRHELTVVGFDKDYVDLQGGWPGTSPFRMRLDDFWKMVNS